MEPEVPSPKPGGFSHLDCGSDPEEKEVSDEDDDDRNHKHRRRETQSHSLERDSMDPSCTRPYRKRGKPFENGHSFRGNESQAGENWKNYNSMPMDRDLTSKFDKRRGLASLSRGNIDLNQRMRSNQTFSGDFGPGRGRGRDNSSWNQRDSRFNLVDIASQMVQPGSVAPSLFAGRGLPIVSNANSSSWSAFGFRPGIPNGSLDALHPIGLQGALGPPLNTSLNMGIPHQRCRDFEERGFCLRGDMCPMEHGVNRIVVEDVQSLSQFNLPVSVPSGQLLTTPAGPGPLPSGVPLSTTLINSKGIHSKSSKPGMNDDVLGLNGAYPGSISAAGADLYDPDQPLWNNNVPEASAVLTGLHSPNIDETESLLNDDISGLQHGRSRNSTDNEFPTKSTGLQGSNLSVWGRIGSSRSRMDTKEKVVILSEYLENDTKEELGAFPSSHGTSHQVKRISTGNDASKVMDSPFKSQTDSMHNSKKPTQKALRTLFVSGIPQKSNKREALLSHFRKFGEVVDIYIPLNSERAFVQFLRREEAEAALKAPDAVMGNRFIRLSWANRDSIPDDGISIGSGSGSGSGASITPRGPTASIIPAQTSVASRRKDDLQAIAQKSNVVHDADVPSLNSPKPVTTNGPKVPPPLQKKLEALRKQQELLEQKRNDFRRQLDKLEKQSSGVKGDLQTELRAKRQKAGIAADPAKASRSFESSASAATPSTLGMVDKNKSAENVVLHSPKLNTTTELQESMSSKLQSRPSVPVAVGHPFPMNRYKLDNRPTAFRVIPPLPSGFADVDVLKEHFLQFGDLSAVELEEIENDGENDDMRSEAFNDCSALITYSTRHSAEMAFVNGKCWQGNNLQFSWLTASNSSNEPKNKEATSSPPPKGSLDAEFQTDCRTSHEVITSGNGKSENSEGKIVAANMESAEVSQHNNST